MVPIIPITARVPFVVLKVLSRDYFSAIQKNTGGRARFALVRIPVAIFSDPSAFDSKDIVCIGVQYRKSVNYRDWAATLPLIGLWPESVERPCPQARTTKHQRR
jgi:hypothetical protein